MMCEADLEEVYRRRSLSLGLIRTYLVTVTSLFTAGVLLRLFSGLSPALLEVLKLLHQRGCLGRMQWGGLGGVLAGTHSRDRKAGDSSAFTKFIRNTSLIPTGEQLSQPLACVPNRPDTRSYHCV